MHSYLDIDFLFCAYAPNAILTEYLATKIELHWQDTEGTTSRGMQYGRRADAGNLHLIGVKGMTTQDHFEHFYSWEDLLRMSSLPEAPQK